ncbi:MAG: hypothetical protein HQK89_04815 [Nitrospirae bacterium]|nr:hypothetical protein [Nitrospirota bacterium]
MKMLTHKAIAVLTKSIMAFAMAIAAFAIVYAGSTDTQAAGPNGVDSSVDSVHAGLLDRVVAFIDNMAITLGEFEKEYEEAKKQTPGVTKTDVINGIINRKLLLEAAKESHISGVDDDDTLKQYINLKIRSYVMIKNEDIENYYNQNKADFEGQPIVSVRGKIEKYLTEEQVNKNLNAQLKELRENSYIRIQLDEQR